MNDIEEQVLRVIGENVDSPDVFTDDSEGLALIRGSINDALQEMCMVLGLYTRDYHLPLLANRQWYRLEPQHDWIAYIVEAYDIQRRRVLDQTDAQTIGLNPWFLRESGNPEKYLFVGHNVFGVWPIPSQEGAILTLKCVCMPKPYTNDYDIIYLREYLQDAVASYAVSEYYASRGDAKRAVEEHGRYMQQAQLTSLNQKLFERQYTSQTVKDVVPQ